MIKFRLSSNKEFLANGAIYYIIVDSDKLPEPAIRSRAGYSNAQVTYPYKLICVDISGKSISKIIPQEYMYGERDKLEEYAKSKGLFPLSDEQAKPIQIRLGQTINLQNQNLQSIALEHYNTIKDDYGRVNNLNFDKKRKILCKFPSLEQGKLINGYSDFHSIIMRIKPSGKHLDIGCGRGKDVIRYLEKHYDSHGIDFHSIQVESAREELQKKGHNPDRISQKDALKMVSFYRERFDIITCNQVYQHFSFKDALRCTKNVANILKDDGVYWLSLKISVDNWADYFNNGVRIIADDLSRGVFSMWDQDLNTWRPGYHLFWISELEEIIISAGLRIVDVPTFDGPKKGIIQYDSSRNYPCVAYYLQKDKNRL